MPTHAMLELTRRCNLRCIHCYIPPVSGQRELGTSRVLTVLDQLAGLGTIYLGLTGGEPTLRRDFADILTRASRVGLLTTVKTNGTLITDRLADAVARAGPCKVDVSVYGATRKTHEAVTGVPGSFEKCRAGIERLVARGIPVAAVCTVMKGNARELDALRRWARGQGIGFRASAVLIPRLDRSPAPLRYRLPPREVLALPRRLGLKRTPARTRPRKTHRHPPLFSCQAGRTEFTITPYGEARACIDLPAPAVDLRTATVKEAWQRLQARTAAMRREPSSPCQDCDLARFCTLCPAYAWLETGDVHGKVDYFCRMARLRAAQAGLGRENPALR